MAKKRRKPGRPARETGALPVIFRHRGGADVDLQLIPHAHLDKLVRGEGDEEAWHTLVFRLNCANAIANKEFSDQPAVQDEIEKAMVSMTEIGKRHKETGKFGCSGDQYRAICEGLRLADEIQAATTRRQQRGAYRWVYGQVGGNTEMLDVMQRGTR